MDEHDRRLARGVGLLDLIGLRRGCGARHRSASSRVLRPVVRPGGFALQRCASRQRAMRAPMSFAAAYRLTGDNEYRGADHDEAEARYLHVAGRLHRRARCEPRGPARQGRRAAARMGRRTRGLAQGSRHGGRRPRQPRQRDRRGGHARHRRRRDGSQDVQRRFGAVGDGSERRRLVGRRSALPRARLRRSPITSASRSSSRAARRSTSSPAASARRSSRPARRPAIWTSPSPAGRASSSSAWQPASWTNFRSTSCRSCWAAGSASSTAPRLPRSSWKRRGWWRRPPSPISASVSAARRLRPARRRMPRRCVRASAARCPSRRFRARPRSPARTAPGGTRPARPAASRRHPCWR